MVVWKLAELNMKLACDQMVPRSLGSEQEMRKQISWNIKKECWKKLPFWKNNGL
jgi:hypothetical protein